MTETIKVYEAKTQFSALLARVENGEEFVVARGTTPIARITAFHPPATRELGFLEYTVPDSFADPLPDEELAAWEGADGL